jgi:Co/Zn/Cd efflux system component
MSFRTADVLMYELFNFLWKDLIGQAALIIALFLIWMAGAITTDQLSTWSIGILTASGVIGGVKVYRLSKKTVRPRA